MACQYELNATTVVSKRTLSEEDKKLYDTHVLDMNPP
jgi:hypothetical protein